ncbi:MAG: RidA family protein [Solirubrobacterales bacterium]
MTSIRHLESTAAVAAPDGSFSHATIAGGFVFVSGQGPFDRDGKVVGPDVKAQTAQVVANLDEILRATGCGLGDMVKVTCHLADIELFDEYDEEYRSLIPPPRPARITIGSELDGVLVEIDCIALRPDP